VVDGEGGLGAAEDPAHALLRVDPAGFLTCCSYRRAVDSGEPQRTGAILAGESARSRTDVAMLAMQKVKEQAQGSAEADLLEGANENTSYLSSLGRGVGT
jgi:hypothetical protein